MKRALYVVIVVLAYVLLNGITDTRPGILPARNGVTIDLPGYPADFGSR